VALCGLFREHEVQKRYRALLVGRLVAPQGPAEPAGGGVPWLEHVTRVLDTLPAEECSEERVVVREEEEEGDRGKRAEMKRNKSVWYVTAPMEGKETATSVRVLGYYQIVSQEPQESRPFFLTLVDLFPHSGRTHQLRKHMKFLKHPIVGDSEHGGTSAAQLQNLHKENCMCLFAVGLTFAHPFTNKQIEVQVAQPAEMMESLPFQLSAFEPAPA